MSVSAVEPEVYVIVSVAAKGKDAKAEEELAIVSVRELYQFASWKEISMLVLACITAAAGGVSMPMLLIGFLNLFESLGAAVLVPGAIITNSEMIKVLTTLLWVAFGLGTARLISVPAIEYCSSSVVLKYKQAYLKAVLRQDVAWYDTTNPEELSTKFAEAIEVVRKGLKYQTMIFEGLGYGLGALVLALLPSIGQPAVCGITLGTVPFLVIPISVLMYIGQNSAKMYAKAYARAGGIATESLLSMRTVVSLGIESNFINRYKAALGSVRFVKVRNDSISGMALGMSLSGYLVMMAAGVLFAALSLATEIEESGLNLTVKDATSGVTLNVCASSPGQISNYSLGPCKMAYQMTCQVGSALKVAGATTLQTLANTPCKRRPLCELFNNCGCSTFTLSPGMENMTMLDLHGFNSMDDLDAYVLEGASAAYLEGNPSYYSCFYGGASTLIAIFGAMMMGEGFSMAGQPIQKLHEARQAAAKILTIIDRVPTIDSFSEAGDKLSSVSGHIEVRDVDFAYPSAPDKMVCNNYSLSVPAGQTVALCGSSGAGKSTIIQLLERFYDPSGGVVMLDGVDIKTLNVRWLRAQFGYVGQEPVLFSGSVALNIGYGSPGASQEAIEEAAKMANAHTFITENLGEGYKTSVGHGGGKLSGGQKQRVAIARAIIKKPKVLLLDEATSALDNESERVVQAALDEIMTKQKRTTIVIAHRLSTIRGADKIAVLDKGTVVEEGTYDELLTTGGLFSMLAKNREEMLATDKASLGGSAPASAAVASALQVEVQVVIDGGDKKDKKEGKQPKEERVKEESAPLARLFAMQADQAPTLFLMFLCSSAGCFLTAFAFYLLALIMEILFLPDPSKVRAGAIRIVIQLLISAAGIISLFSVSGFCNGLAGSALTAKLRSRGMAALMRQEMAFFDHDENSAPEMTAFLAEKVDKVKTIVTDMFDLIAQFLGGVAALVMVLVLFSCWQLLLAWMLMIVIISVIAPLEAAFMTGKTEADTLAIKGKEDTSKMGMVKKSANNIIGDAVIGIRTVASFNLEHQFYDAFCATNSTISKYEIQDSFVSGLFLALTMYVTIGGLGVIFWYSIYLSNLGLTDITGVMAPILVIMGLLPPIMKMSALADLKVCTQAAVKLFALFDREPTIDNLDTTPGAEPNVVGAIELRDITFAYPTALDQLVCKGYSLSIAAGQTIALCGPSGSGKSTAINLIERFYDPLSGVVLLDGVDIKTLNVRWLRAQFGYVGQEPVLFQGTVAENIAYGSPGASQEAIEEAAKMANAHTFITENLGEGYKTDVGLKGGKLSGGQKQRVAIARAIIKKPKVLLLDEATSALDNESERVVQAALDEIMTKQKRTTIVIAHRLSTIRGADKIAVISDGVVLEQGTHDELLANQNMYANLVMAAA